MIDHRDQLREAMQAHEHLAPEPAAVYARVQELARTYRRRRVIAQTASGAVLGVAVIVGAFQIPNLTGGPSAPTGGTAVVQPAAPQASSQPPVPTAPSSEPSDDDPMFTPAEQKARETYFAKGYSFAEAEKLGKIWKLKDIDQVKIKAGYLLQAGKKLPVKVAVDPGGSSTAEEAHANAFFAEGYDFDDAAKLADLWKLPTPWDAKVAGGKKIEAGETLPFQP